MNVNLENVASFFNLRLLFVQQGLDDGSFWHQVDEYEATNLSVCRRCHGTFGANVQLQNLNKMDGSLD